MARSTYDEEVDLKAYLDVVWRGRWVILAAVVCALAFVWYSGRNETAVYQAGTKIFMHSSSSSAASQYTGLASMLGISLSSSGGSVTDLMDLIKSEAVAKKVLDDLDLTHRIKGWDDPKIPRRNLISAVSGMLVLPKNPGGNLIELKAVAGEPQLAADLANEYAAALAYYWNEMNVTEARNKIKYIEAELPRVRMDLREAEYNVKLLPPGASSGITDKGGVQGEYALFSEIYNMLRREYESAKLDAAKEMPPFVVIDRAEKPLTRVPSKMREKLLIGLAAGLFGGTFLAFFVEYWKNSAKA